MSIPVKFPRIGHLPGSPGATSDDRWLSPEGLAYLRSVIDLVVTEKMDGGNVTMMRDHFYARSVHSGTHPWDTYARRLWSKVRFDIPDGWRISGESLYARRSVGYDALPGYYMVFGVWDAEGSLLSWDTTVEWADLLGLPTVPVLYRGVDFKQAVNVWTRMRDPATSEGFVIRDAGPVASADFSQRIAKYVRAGHVQTPGLWRHRDDFEVNGMREPNQR
jgi:hypothetical protein